MTSERRTPWTFRLLAIACAAVSSIAIVTVLTGTPHGDAAVVGTGAGAAGFDESGSPEGGARALAAPPVSAVQVQAPPTIAPPAPTAPPTTAPAPPPTTAPPPPPPPPPTTAPPAPMTLEERLASIVPPAWHAALPVRIEIIEGSISWGQPGLIQIARSHATGSIEFLEVVIAHEFGHVIAFEFGTRAYLGAAPAGWPPATVKPAEHWADCVQQVFVGTVRPSHGLPPCTGAQLDWTARYLAAGPG